MKLQVLIAACLVSAAAVSQPVLRSVDSNSNFFGMCKQYEEYFASLPADNRPGYKNFKRWEAFWKPRVGIRGKFPPANHLETERQKMLTGTIMAKSKPPGGQWVYNGGSNKPDANIGRVNCIAFHPTDPHTFWVGAPTGGLWKTTDHGVTWTTTTDNLPVIGVSDIAVDPQNPNIIYIASGDADAGYLPSGPYGTMHVLKSTDGGNSFSPTVGTWSVTAQPLIRRLLIDPANPQVIIAATSAGIHRSSDGGATWIKTLTSEWFIDLEFRPGNSSVVYASTKTLPSKIYTSNDNGVTWNLVSTLANCYRTELAVSPADTSRVLAVSSSTNAGLGGLWRSADGGASYTQIYSGNCSNNLLGYSYQGNGCGGQGGYDLALALDPLDANKAWVGGINTWHSADGGINWTIKNVWTIHQTTTVPTIHADKHFLAFNPHNPGELFECNDGGLFVTTDNGVTWNDLSAELGISQIYRLGTSVTTPSMVICGFQDGGTKVRINGAWGHVFSGDGMECIIDPVNAGTMYYSYQNGVIVKTANGGINITYLAFANFTSIGPDGFGDWTTPFVMHPTNNNTLLMGKISMYQSVNGGTTWATMDPNMIFQGFINSISYAPSNPSVIYASCGPWLNKTTNGATWQSVISFSDNITYTAVHPKDPNTIWVTLSGYTAGNKVMKSIDGGLSWTNVSAGIPNIPVNCIVYCEGSSDALYIGTDLGAFYSDKTLGAWVPYGAGRPNIAITELEISKSDGLIWAATYGRGLWSISPACVALSQPTVSAATGSLCSGTSTKVDLVTQDKGASISWSLPAGWTWTGTDTSRLVSPSSTGALTITALNNCGDSKKTFLPLQVVHTPTLHINATSTTVCSGERVELLVIGGPKPSWSTGDLTTNITLTPTASAVYTVTSSIAGCTGTASVFVEARTCAGLPEHTGTGIRVYPNPSGGEITIVTNLSAPLRLIDVLGRTVEVINYNAPVKKEVHIHNLAPGVYFITDLQKTRLLSEKIIVME